MSDRAVINKLALGDGPVVARDRIDSAAATLRHMHCIAISPFTSTWE
ncbi:MAG: hypothetical protein JW913_20475 [Chitinispirillaceae bacterium]|nr:hypothetical protein [Chitinispirillaceae bacterium]